MKIVAFILLSVLLIASTLTTAQSVKRQNAPDEQAFAAFWQDFKTAIANDNKAAVASMTKLPFLFDGKELDSAGFVKNYDRIFDRAAKQCIARSKPIKDQGAYYSVFCGETIYGFAKHNGRYKFDSIGAND